MKGKGKPKKPTYYVVSYMHFTCIYKMHYPIQARTRNLTTGENVQKWTRYFLLFFSTRPSDKYDSLRRRKNSRPLLDVFACIGYESIFWFVLSKKCLSENYDELVIFYNRRKYPHQKKINQKFNNNHGVKI